MKGFRVEGQQLGTARTETVARPGECRRIGHATKLHSLKRHKTHEDPGFGGPIPVTVGTFETKVRPLRGFRALSLGGGGGDTMGGVGGGTETRHETTYIYIYIYVCVCVYIYICLFLVYTQGCETRARTECRQNEPQACAFNLPRPPHTRSRFQHGPQEVRSAS